MNLGLFADKAKDMGFKKAANITSIAKQEICLDLIDSIYIFKNG